MEIEAELLLLGKWRNVEELEEHLSLPEMRVMLEAQRDKEHKANKFAAALKGIDLDKGRQEDAEERFDQIQRRVQARLSGASEEQIEHDELGFGFEIEE